MTGVVIPDITEDLILRTWKWFDNTLAEEPRLNAGTFVLIEMMQKARLPPLFHQTSPLTYVTNKSI